MQLRKGHQSPIPSERYRRQTSATIKPQSRLRRIITLKVHSIRKYFKTQLLALGVQSNYVDYMVGHTIDTYHNIQMKGTEFLRNISTASRLSIRPKSQISKVEALKEIITS